MGRGEWGEEVLSPLKYKTYSGGGGEEVGTLYKTFEKGSDITMTPFQGTSTMDLI